MKGEKTVVPPTKLQIEMPYKRMSTEECTGFLRVSMIPRTGGHVLQARSEKKMNFATKKRGLEKRTKLLFGQRPDAINKHLPEPLDFT